MNFFFISLIHSKLIESAWLLAIDAWLSFDFHHSNFKWNIIVIIIGTVYRRDHSFVIFFFCCSLESVMELIKMSVEAWGFFSEYYYSCMQCTWYPLGWFVVVQFCICNYNDQWSVFTLHTYMSFIRIQI